MSAQRIRVRDGAALVEVYLYDTPEAMRRAGRRFSGATDLDDAIGLCQGSTHIDADGGATFRPVVRLVRGHLGTEVLAHEMHHAVTAIYGCMVEGQPTSEVLTHYNEPFAYLYGRLLARLVSRLYALGCYE